MDSYMEPSNTFDHSQRKPVGSTKQKAITPELVRAVADKVYDLFLQDMKLAHERTGRSNGGSLPTRSSWRGR